MRFPIGEFELFCFSFVNMKRGQAKPPTTDHVLASLHASDDAAGSNDTHGMHAARRGAFHEVRRALALQGSRVASQTSS